jgi:hypothetical protein
MVLNDNDSSWVAQRLIDAINTVEMNLQEAINRIHTEYTRPSVIRKARVRRLQEDRWVAFIGDSYIDTIAGSGFSAAGSTPEEAMREFDRLWKGGTD